jgi:hypothetical protein
MDNDEVNIMCKFRRGNSIPRAKEPTEEESPSKQALSLIQSNRFEQAYELLSFLSNDEKFNLLATDWFQEDGFHIYIFLLYLLQKEHNVKEKAKWHNRCNGFLAGRPIIDDYMCFADWHLREALRLDSNNIEYMKSVLQDWSHPDTSFTNVEFMNYAMKVLEYESDHPIANLVRAKYNC